MPRATRWTGVTAPRAVTAIPSSSSPRGMAGPALQQADQAKRVCQSCPVRTPCLDFALRHGLGFGIWGGVTGESDASCAARD